LVNYTTFSADLHLYPHSPIYIIQGRQGRP